MTDNKLKTMADLHDHTAKHRAEILPARGQIASIEFDIEEINRRLKQAADKLAEAEALTPGFESKATSGNAKSQERAEQQYGAPPSSRSQSCAPSLPRSRRKQMQKSRRSTKS